MKRVFGGLLMLLALSSFVFAASSEISADFFMDVPQKEVVNYVPSGNAVGDYLGFVIFVLVILVFVYFVFKEKKAGKVSRRVSKKKKAIKKVRKR